MSAPMRPYCHLCSWRQGGPGSWDGRACRCGLSSPPLEGPDAIVVDTEDPTARGLHSIREAFDAERDGSADGSADGTNGRERDPRGRYMRWHKDRPGAQCSAYEAAYCAAYDAAAGVQSDMLRLGLAGR